MKRSVTLPINTKEKTITDIENGFQQIEPDNWKRERISKDGKEFWCIKVIDEEKYTE